MRGFENQVRGALEGGQTVNYSSIPIYAGNGPMPVGVTLGAEGSGETQLLGQHPESGAIAMPSALGQLISLVAPRGLWEQHHDWASVERSLGTDLPADYKGMVDAYGPGSFDGFVWILQPHAANPNLDLMVQRTARLEALRVLQAEGEIVPYEVDGDSEEILPWAITDNGDVCFWLRDGGDPDDWSVVINESRGSAWEAFEGSTTEFLTAVISRRHRIDVFPDDFPSGEPAFEPLIS